MAAPAQMKALVAVVPDMSPSALTVSFRGGALRVLGRASEIDREALIDELSRCGVKGKECAGLLGACEFLVRQARKVGDSSKLAPRLTPLGFTPESLQCLEDTLGWMEQGAPTEEVPEPEPEPEPDDSDNDSEVGGPDEDEDIDEETKAMLEGALAAASDESASSDDDDDDDDDDELDTDGESDSDDGFDVDIPLRAIKLPVDEGMRAVSKLTDEQLHHFLRATLMHMLKKDIPAEKLDALDQMARDNEIIPEELPSLLQHLQNLLRHSGKDAAQTEDPDAHDYAALRSTLSDASWGSFSEFKQDIVVGATKRWKREILEQRAHAADARRKELKAQLSIEGFLLKRGEMNTDFKRRWFELKGNEVRYYKNRGEKKPAGVFHYGGANITLISAHLDESSSIEVKHIHIELPGRVYVLQGETDGSQQAWFSTLQAGARQYKMIMEDEYADDDDDTEAGGFSGYLLKQGEKNKKFKRRWCVLNGVTVKYFKDEEAEEPAGVFHIGGAVIEKLDGFVLNVKLPHRTYVLKATKQADLDAWAEAFELAQAFYRDKGHAKTTPAAAAKSIGKEESTAEEGVPPEGTAAGASIGVHSEVPKALDETYVLGTMKQFQALEIVKRPQQVDEEREVTLRTTICGLVVVDADDEETVLMFCPNNCVLGLQDGGTINQGKLRTARIAVKPRRAIEDERVKGATDKQHKLILHFVMGNPQPFGEALMANIKASKKLGAQAEVCADTMVRQYFNGHPGTRVGAFKEGMLEKLGEGGMRGKLGAKKWQWRLVSLNEETLAWYAETSAGGGAGGTAEDAMTEMAGSIAIKDIEKVWASAGKAKGRAEDLCMQIEGKNLPHSYTLAAANRKDRDAWVVALRRMAAAHSIALETE